MNFIKRIIIIGLLIIIEPFSGYSQSFKDLDSMILHCVIDFATRRRMFIQGRHYFEVDVNSRNKLWWFHRDWLFRRGGSLFFQTYDVHDYPSTLDDYDFEDDDEDDDEDEDDERPNVWWLDCGSMVSPDFVDVYKDTLSKYEILLFPNENPRDINKSIKKELKRGIQSFRVYVDIEGGSIVITIIPVLIYWTCLDGVNGSIAPAARYETRFRYSPENESWELFKKW